MADMARAGGIDVLTGDYLAEVTMLILGKARAKDSTKGYATTFLQHLGRRSSTSSRTGSGSSSTPAGLNPAGLADATRDLIARHGHDLRVSHVEGDDVFGRLDAMQQAGHSLPNLTSGEPLSSWSHQPLTANAYLGGFGIARALHHGADIVITGRVADASLVVGPAAWWWSWSPDDYDALAGAVCAGHVIECGPQATGGNFSGFPTIADLLQPGFPIAEIAADGSSVITKNPGTGGAVTRDTVTAQLVYEIGEPAYLNPDVITHLDTATLTDLGDDRVQIRGVRGSAPPATTKVAITGGRGLGEQRGSSRSPAPTSTRRPPSSSDPSTATRRPLTGSTRSRSTGSGRPNTIPTARTPEPSCSRSQCRGPGGRRARLLLADGRAGPVQLPRVVLPRPAPSRVGLRCVLARTARPGSTRTRGPPPRRHHLRSSHPEPTRRRGQGNPCRATCPPAQPVPAPWTADELVVAALGAIVHARSGDKGGDANLGVWVRDRHAWDWLKSTLTVDELRRLLPETRELAISRYELPNLGAVNFVLRGLLGTWRHLVPAA
jgi:hypothetical protein